MENIRIINMKELEQWLNSKEKAPNIEDIIDKICKRRDFYYKIGDTAKSNALQEVIEMFRED